MVFDLVGDQKEIWNLYQFATTLPACYVIFPAQRNTLRIIFKTNILSLTYIYTRWSGTDNPG